MSQGSISGGASDPVVLKEASGAGPDSVTLQAPTSLGASYTLTLPGDDGASGQYLSTNGSGVLSWMTPPGGGGITGTGVSVDSEIMIWDGVGGSAAKRATGTGVVHATSGVYSVSNVALTSEVTGVLPIANGGTNSSSALSNNRVMVSSGGAVVEASAITASRALESNGSGIPIASSVTSTELGHLSGVTSAIQTQINAKASNSFETIACPSGTNPVADTNTDTLTLTSDGLVTVTGTSGTDSIAFALANTAVTPGSYGSASAVGTFTVDAQGRLTAAANASIAIASTAVSDFNEAAQDAVGGILTDTASVDFTYSDAGNTISAAVLPAGVDHNSLANLTTGDPHTQYAQNSFSTIDCPSGTDPVADSRTDTLTLTSSDSSITITGTSGTDTVDFVVVDSAIDHGSVGGLTDDDHSQYALLAGRSGGQVITGGTASGDDLTLRSTSNATKGDLILADEGGNVLIGGGTSASEVRLLEPSGSGTNYTAIKAQAQSANVTYTLPPADATVSGYLLSSNASGSLSWISGGVNVYEAGSSVVSGASRIDFKDLNVENPSGTLADVYLNLPSINGGRLTTESGQPLSSTDRTAQGTIYFTPFNGNRISLYDGTRWQVFTFSEVSLALTATSGSNYDVFLYNNAGTLTLELSAAWTDNITRADAVSRQDGVFVKTSDKTRRLLGSMRASGSNVTQDTTYSRYLVNIDNLMARPVYVSDGTDNWTYTTATYRQKNGSTANQFDLICPNTSRNIVSLYETGIFTNSNSAPVAASVGIGLDSTTGYATGSIAPRASSVTISAVATVCAITATLTTGVAAGYHFFAELEISNATGTTTWYGDNGGSVFRSGLTGWCAC